MQIIVGKSASIKFIPDLCCSYDMEKEPLKGFWGIT